jgi:predicted transglutaminase-like cysteine proteinase
VRKLALAAALCLLAVPVAAAPPVGYQIFCLQNPAECGASGASVAAISVDDLARINRAVNASIVARNDPGADVWTVNPTAGDCEDYALTKRHLLRRAGVPTAAMSIGITRALGQDHAVLIVRTNAGAFVLDNLTNELRPYRGGFVEI